MGTTRRRKKKRIDHPTPRDKDLPRRLLAT